MGAFPSGALPPSALRRSCEPEAVPFETTADVQPADEIVGQDRAVDAVRFGIAIRRDGYNLFAVGPPGLGKQSTLRQLLGRQAAAEPAPPDWVYVNDFDDPRRPRALELAAGRGAALRDAMDCAIRELQVAMRGAFDSDEYRTRLHALAEALKDRRMRSLQDLQARAARQDIAVLQTDSSIGLAVLRDGAVLPPDEFERLPQPEQAALREKLELFGKEVGALLTRFHTLAHEHHDDVAKLDREIAGAAARKIIDRVRDGHRDCPAVLEYLDRVEADVIDNHEDFLGGGTGEGFEAALRRTLHGEDGPGFRRYRVNLLVDNGGAHGAPVVYEDHPTHANLIGRSEHEAQLGALVTNFTLIKAGALHRAAGGYLLLDALEVLRQPFAWEGLKRALRRREIRVESLGRFVDLVQGISLEPQAIPLRQLKVVLFGDRLVYYLLAALDPEFPELFKVLADFDESMDRGGEAQARYAMLIAALVQKEGLRPFDRGATARIIEHAARVAGDVDKLSVHMRLMCDLLREADLQAGLADRALVVAADVQAAIDAQERRAGRLRDRMLEAVEHDTVLIETAGEKVAQVNGLAVVALGEHAFGHPVRITARVRVGKGEVTDVEREAELGGPIHAKGVLILTGFLGNRFATRTPLSLAASLVFEQSYGPVEGDSASLAETCALLSALADAPVKQSLAVTGSIDQHGRVQAIGGVNEKIEGFFDLCQRRGLSGEQGVIIPRANVRNLMLRPDVVAAVAAGNFAVHAVADVDEAISLLTGRAAGAREAAGEFPADSVNAAVDARLQAFAAASRAFLSGPASAPGAAPCGPG